MREIKFRALSNGVMVYGLPFIDIPGDWCMDVLDNPVTHLIDRKTLGEYTGLKDKNGKEIYEGDIVQIGSYCPFLVEYKIEPEHRLDIGFNIGDARDYEIIGNIHENYELLKEKQ